MFNHRGAIQQNVLVPKRVSPKPGPRATEPIQNSSWILHESHSSFSRLFKKRACKNHLEGCSLQCTCVVTTRILDFHAPIGIPACSLNLYKVQGHRTFPFSGHRHPFFPAWVSKQCTTRWLFWATWLRALSLSAGHAHCCWPWFTVNEGLSLSIECR